MYMLAYSKYSISFLIDQREEPYLFLLLVEIVDDDTNEQVESEKRAKNNKDDKVKVHIDVVLVQGLFSHLGSYNK